MADNTQSNQNTPARTRSIAYYLQHVIIDVEGCLYSIPKQVLMSQSPVFEGMFDGNNDGGGEGASDEKPIVLEGYKSKDFECLMKVMLPPPLKYSLPVLAKDEWASVLKLSTVWQMDQVRQLAIEQLSGLDLSPIEKVIFAREYRVLKWLTEGVSTLAAGFSEYKFEDIAKELGWETTSRILSVRDVAKPKVPGLDELTQGWRCFRHSNEVNYRPATGYVVCNAGCGVLLTIPSVPGTSNGAKGKLTVSEDVVSTMFAEEIKVLQA